MIEEATKQSPGAQQPGRIECAAVAKHYRVAKQKSGSIKELFIQGLRRREAAVDVRALDGVDLVVEPGESLGVIGSNGSGKSTLLKMIAGIITPTEGRIDVGGRVAALLELGAGFHPELSGYENIFLMGSLIGMTHAEALERVDDIIDFAELRDFIHTPVKHYSTGMYVRLGFSVATHVDPDIVLLDEVISVGDGAFQAKSFDRVAQMRRDGKTVLLVTHKLDEAETTCDKLLWLEKGRARDYGPTTEVIARSQARMLAEMEETDPVDCDIKFTQVKGQLRMGSGEVLTTRVELLDDAGVPSSRFPSGGVMRVRVHYQAQRPVDSLICQLGIGSVSGVPCAVVDSGDQELKGVEGEGVIDCAFSPIVLGADAYRLTVALSAKDTPFDPYDLHLRLYPFEVTEEKRRRFHPHLSLPAGG